MTKIKINDTLLLMFCHELMQGVFFCRQRPVHIPQAETPAMFVAELEYA